MRIFIKLEREITEEQKQKLELVVRAMRPDLPRELTDEDLSFLVAGFCAGQVDKFLGVRLHRLKDWKVSASERPPAPVSRHSPLELTVGIVSGADIAEAAAAILELSRKLGMFVKANFNDTDIWSSERCTAEDIIARWHKARGPERG